VEPITRVLLVANRTATELPLIEAVRRRAQHGPATFHLVVPATPRGLHRVVDPEDAGREAAAERLARALPGLSKAAGVTVLGHVGDANPLAAVTDALRWATGGSCPGGRSLTPGMPIQFPNRGRSRGDKCG
jgi:hypothetical protein